MLTYDGIELLDLHFFGHGALVLGRGVEMTGAGAGFQFDFFTHDGYSLNLFAGSTQVRQDGIDAILVDRTQRSIGDTQADPAILAFYPEFAILQIGQETALGLVVCMGNVVPDHRLFAGNLTYACHGELRIRKRPHLYHEKPLFLKPKFARPAKFPGSY